MTAKISVEMIDTDYLNTYNFIKFETDAYSGGGADGTWYSLQVQDSSSTWIELIQNVYEQDVANGQWFKVKLTDFDSKVSLSNGASINVRLRASNSEGDGEYSSDATG